MILAYKDNTRTRRFASKVVKSPKQKRIKALQPLLQKHSGRSGGQIMVRHQGGRQKRFYRQIDFKRNKFDVTGVVAQMEYDPNRNVEIALIKYSDGEFRYILAPKDLKVGDSIVSSEKTEIKAGNTLKLKNVPVGTVLNNVEMVSGKGGQLARSAGTGVVLQAKESGHAHLKLNSGEIRMVSLECLGTIGVLGNEDYKNLNLGKAGRSRHIGIRPSVRGTAMDPSSHPHGGGEGRSSVGRKKPMTYFGKPAVGKTRKKNKYTSKFIVKRRN